MEFSLLFVFVAGAAAFFVGASKGGLPMVGVLGVPLLALVMPPRQACLSCQLPRLPSPR